MKQRRWNADTYGKGFVRTDGGQRRLEVWSTDEDGRPTIPERHIEFGFELEPSAAITFSIHRSRKITPDTDDAASLVVLERLLNEDGRFRMNADNEWLFG